jgi:hypothetical protein
MRGVSAFSIIAAVITALIGLISRLRVVPVFGLESKAFAGIAALFLIFAIAVNTLPEDL